MKKVLITGFEAFAGNHSNPTHDLMIELSKSGYQTLVLPVSFSRSWAVLEAIIKQERPDWVISCGVAAKRETIDFERVAINFMDAGIADNDGDQPNESVISTLDPECYLSDLPLNNWKRKLEDKFPVKVSLSAGSYVCNYIYFQLMRHRARYQYKSVFIHFPYATENLSLQSYVGFMHSFLSIVEESDSE